MVKDFIKLVIPEEHLSKELKSLKQVMLQSFG
jgi:hypothetical protein